MIADEARQANFAAASRKLLATDATNNRRGSKRMTPVAAGTAIGAAALTVGRGALGAVGNGLSFTAELVRAATGTPSPEQKPVDPTAAARTALKARTEELRQRIEQALAAAGVQLTEPVELVRNGQGGIAVAGAHPQLAAIEAAVGSDVLLERDFNQLAGDYSEMAETSDLAGALAITIPKAG